MESSNKNPDPKAQSSNVSIKKVIDEGIHLRGVKMCVVQKTALSVVPENASRTKLNAPIPSTRKLTIPRQPTPPIYRRRRCPLRIAELAEPSQRLCLEAWRENRDKLPCFMVDRLKKRLTEGRMVSLPEAISCFKLRKQRKPGCKRPEKNGKTIFKTDDDQSMLRLLCAVLTHRMSERLLKPVNINLNKDLQKIADIVATEIKRIMYSKKYQPDYVYNTNILNEISGQMATWIAAIMGDTEYKMIEDELRAKKTKENRMGMEGNMVTLIEQYVQYRKKTSQELEEEEGPALDALETLMDNVLNTCIPTDAKPITIECQDQRDGITDNKQQGKNFDGENTSNNDQKVENWLLDSDENLTSSELSNVNQVEKILEEILLLTDPNMVFDGQIQNQDSDEEYASMEDAESNAGDSKEIVDHIADEIMNVSDVNETFEDPLDERKTVTFINVGNGLSSHGGFPRASDGGFHRGPTGGFHKGPLRGSHRDSYGSPDDAYGGSHGKSYAGSNGSPTRESGRNHGTVEGRAISSEFPEWKSHLINIRFQPPNESILNEVDESWPTDVTQTTMKLTDNVSKSVTSLGNLKEIDEMDYLLDDDESSDSREDVRELITAEQFNATNVVVDLSSKNQSFSPMLSHSTDKITPAKLLHELSNMIGVTANVKSKESTDIRSDNFKDKSKGDNAATECIKDDVLGKNLKHFTVKTKQKISQDVYRVHIATAPAWVKNCRSNNTVPVKKNQNKRPIVTNRYLLKWLTDLQYTLINLEKWNLWLSDICKNILTLKKNSMNHIDDEYYDTKVLKEWIKLERSINKDAILWKQLNDQTMDALTAYTPHLMRTKVKSQTQCYKYKINSFNESLRNIKRLSLWLHNSINSANNKGECKCAALTLRKPRCKQE